MLKNYKKMRNLRKYGKSPYVAAVIHGGPGAPGEMSPVAKELSYEWGILEPLQTASSVDGQIQELHNALAGNGDLPVILIGSSWGAWLGFIFAAYYPSFVKKLILVGSGPYEERYAAEIIKTRLNRLSEEERTELQILEESLKNPIVKNKNTLFTRFGELFNKTDSCDPVDLKTESIKVQFDIYQSVWGEAVKLRQSGYLLKIGKQIQCPVVAIHGDYDPHPYRGVKEPLSRTIRDFKFILLKECGHRPWIEKSAGERFFEILKEELKT